MNFDFGKLNDFIKLMKNMLITLVVYILGFLSLPTGIHSPPLYYYLFYFQISASSQILLKA